MTNNDEWPGNRPGSGESPDELPSLPHWFEGSEYTHRVACAIAKYGPIARTTLAQLLGLSQGSLSRITSDLIYAGVIEELPGDSVTRGPLPQGFTPKESSDRRGRPQTALALCANARTFVGVKANGTSAVAAAVNAHGEVVSGRHEAAFPDRSPESVTATIARLVNECVVDVTGSALPAPIAVGVAIGGHVADDDRTVTFAPFLRWDHDVPLAEMVTRATNLPCGVYNDIDSLLVDASWFGPGVGLEAFAVLTIGIGIGYSLAMRGRPVSYPDKSYGLLGHVLVDPEGPRCTAGHIGCAQCLTDDSLADQYSQMMGRACTFDDFARDARAGVPQASRLLDKTCFRLGSLIATVANIAMPSKVMVAGESAFLAKMAIDPIRDGINRYRHSQASPVEFTVVDHDWQLWAKAAASRVIARYLE
ncbi:ROK family protein [Bifidobacterium callitrichos]|uniref:NagC family transcriptional regulator n=1 Tax=Bifidobacterium callitrichos DSM 23973 TaxID=1437609 RepID=A0A087A305_9BIFI|nr:ROK family protein [Bifidobacterium callitrichos]KFI53155.1 NagC family transcriptional regulator [Bifidobacterium callitrichos DSM 23973]